jgi:hypothetical protein
MNNWGTPSYRCATAAGPKAPDLQLIKLVATCHITQSEDEDYTSTG